MKKSSLLILFLCLINWAYAQPEFYAEPYIGHPEFRALPLRWTTASPDSFQLLVNVRILYDDLQFIKLDNQFQARYGLDVFLLQNRQKVLANQRVDRKIIATNFAQTNSRSQGDQNTLTFTLPTENCWLRIVVTDEESRQERILEKEILLPAKEWQGALRLGDIALFDSSGYVLMNTGLLAGQPLQAAYSLYCADPDSLSCQYELFNARDQIVQSGKITYEISSAFQLDTLNLATNNLSNGSYRLFIEARSQSLHLARVFPFKILQENLPDYIQDLEAAIKQLKYIASDEEMERFQSMPLSQREEVFVSFWKKRDPTPGTPNNERMEEYYRRIHYANENFSSAREGWESDRGQVYVIFGAPSEVNRHPFNVDKKPYEIWNYYDINREFLFVDDDGFGDYRLRGPLWEN